MEQLAIYAINFVAKIFDGLNWLVIEIPFFGQALPFFPILPSLIQRSIFGVVLSGLLGVVAVMAFVLTSPSAGFSVWCSAWVLSFWMARNRKRKRSAMRASRLALQQYLGSAEVIAGVTDPTVIASKTARKLN